MRVTRAWLLGCVAASGCAEHPPAVIEDRSSIAETSAPEVRRASQISMTDRGELPIGPDYVVQPGDTLYAIAFRLGMDYRSLAALNQIDAPYVIRVGQSLATEAPKVVVAAASASSAEGDAAMTTGTPELASAAGANGKVAADTATVGKGSTTSARRPGASATTSPAKAAPPEPQPVAPTPKPVASPKPKSPPAAIANAPVDRWGWPVKGRIIRSYAEDVHKGIDLAGARGDQVRASAGGVVVYAGTGVTGYGALIIIKHNDTYLSAYGHNDELLAAEGEQVSAGKLIARMGSSGTDSVKLHFEIRRNGRPIDPATLLSSR